MQAFVSICYVFKQLGVLGGEGGLVVLVMPMTHNGHLE